MYERVFRNTLSLFSMLSKVKVENKVKYTMLINTIIDMCSTVNDKRSNHKYAGKCTGQSITLFYFINAHK